MADITLTPAEVGQYDGLEASQVDIDDAKPLMQAQTGYTAEEHRDLRTVPESAVKRAWAIASDRLRRQTKMAGDEDITAETQDGYSYSLRGGADPMRAIYSGKPWELLELGTHGSWHNSRGMVGANRIVPGFYDDYGVWFPDP